MCGEYPPLGLEFFFDVVDVWHTASQLFGLLVEGLSVERKDE
jgi:hypothetical protein